MNPIERLLALLCLALLVGFVWMIYDLKKAPIIKDDYARKIDKAEDDAARK